MAAATSSAASAGRMNPAATSAAVWTAHRATNCAWVGYSAANLWALNGVVVPNRKQNDDPDWPRPDRVATGTSTAGVATPPLTFALASRTNEGAEPDVVTCRRHALAGDTPVVTQRLSSYSAASTT